SSVVLPGTAPIELVLDVPREHAPPGCSAPALRLRCRCAYVGERVLANPGHSREGRVLVRPACCRGLRPSSWCSTFPGSVLLRGVAHLRYACVVCAHTSASGCSPTRGIPGRDEYWFVRRAAGDCAHRAGARRSRGACSPGVQRTGATPALSVRIRRRAGARQPVVFPGGTSTSSSGGLGRGFTRGPG